MLFQFQNISKQFSEQFILQHFSFEIEEGDKVNIAGRSGIGKTTLFRLILGFEKPDEGCIYYKGVLLNERTVWLLRREVAYVCQDLAIGSGSVRGFFDDTLSLKANLKNKTGVEESIKSLMDYFELPETMLDKNMEELSGGEKQRVAIINALLLKRTIFLLDEVTSALDVDLREKVMAYFLSRKEFTVLYISHNNHLQDNVKVKTIQLKA
ncbi:MAG: ATP-binding cassette domain-containing protein [Paludibacteraceae bacterium]|nr:ATP-binding cassette domain-containing protein [Paludibacteraceae bacterium]